jgi:RHS repeat-associated protein
MNKTMKISSITIAVIFLLTSWAAFAAETVVYYHTDPAGTPLAMTDSRDNVIWKAHYRPFGEEQSVTGTAENNRKFVGKEKDTESGLSYFGARYLKSDVGRFISPDPMGAVDPWTGKENSVILHNPQRLNQYAYGLNNPYRYVDADGRIAWFIPPLIAAGSAFGYNMFSPSTVNAPGLGESTIASQTTGEFLVDVALLETGGRLIVAGVKAIFSRAAIETGGKLSAQAEKSIASLENRILEHEQKLAEFKANPTVRPGMENLPKELIRKQQARRIELLETEIQKFKNNIEKIKSGEL